MKKNITILFMFISFVFAQNTQQYTSLFSDYRAAKVGDVVTIIIVESSQASNKAEVSTGKKSDLGFKANATMGLEPMLPAINSDINSNNNFKGGGSTKSQGLVKARISALIDSVYANGNLRIKGTRKILINGEEQMITITGIIRGVDIRSNNTVYSNNISNAEIAFSGKGKLDDAQNPGWLTKVFHWLF